MSKAAILLACLARAAGDAPALLGRPADTSLKSVPRFPGPAATECFAGEVAGRAYAEGSGHALVNFSAFVTFRAEGCKVNHLTAYNGSATAPWYSGAAASSTASSRRARGGPLPQVRQRSDSFLSSGAYDELERLAAQRPVSPEMREAERRLPLAPGGAAAARTGASVTPDGKALLFGVGRRDFRHSTSPGTPSAPRGPRRRHAPRAGRTLFDGHWHDVLVARVVAGAASTLYVYVDGELAASGPGRAPEGTYAAITELDVRFFAGAPIADLVDDALERCGDGCDGVFQREDDTSLHRNLGFMVIKVDRRVKKLFATWGSPRRHGAQRRPLGAEKLFTLDDAFVAGAARPILRTTVFPAAEVATRAFLLQLALRYKHKGAFALYHVNDFGGISSPDKARDAKMAELDVIERAVYNARRAGEEECNATAAERAGIVASYLVGPRPKKRKLPKKKHVTLDLTPGTRAG
ncbi:hypothetical protein JL720_4693 [Aureococcus anophagefferens]|nr:hypothetical protein JL720_4693 [Aureococcus anophagefferens]